MAAVELPRFLRHAGGYDVEVSRAIAEKLGVEPEYVESDWDSLFAGLDAGRYDMVCNGVEVTEERAKTYAFTTPYGYIHTALAVRKDNTDITSFEDLKGKTTANSLASPTWSLPRATALPCRASTRWKRPSSC